MTVRTRSQLNSDADTNLPDNTTGGISPADVRQRVKDIADSTLLPEDHLGINAASAKTTPVDADLFGLIDSAASNVLKKVTWANIKATLKTYFDTLYAAVAGSVSQAFSVASLDIGHASDTTVTRASAGRIAVEGDMLLDVTDMIDEDDMASNSANHVPTQQSVNQFVKSRPGASDRLVTISDSASPSFNAQSGITQVARLTATGDREIQAPTNPADGQKIIIEHTASGGARTISFATGTDAFDLRGKTIEATPSGETDYFGFVYNDAAERWRLLAVDKQA